MILNLFILPFRPQKSAHAYQTIWTEKGSPLVVFTRDLTAKLADAIADEHLIVDYAMRYGTPSVRDALIRIRMQQAGVDQGSQFQAPARRMEPACSFGVNSGIGFAMALGAGVHGLMKKTTRPFQAIAPVVASGNSMPAPKKNSAAGTISVQMFITPNQPGIHIIAPASRQLITECHISVWKVLPSRPAWSFPSAPRKTSRAWWTSSR